MHVVITGASSGIGEALVREYAASGASITMVARRTEMLESIAAELDTKTHVVTADLSDLEHCASWVEGAIEALGPIDGLINNAGMQVVECFESGDPDVYDRVLRVNLNAPMRLTRAIVPAMIERNRGFVVNIASLAALAPTPFMSSYNASKGGLAAASEALRGQLLATGVTVLTVYPGPVKTAMADAATKKYDDAGGGTASKMPTGDTATLARKVRRASERRKRRIIYPWIYTVSTWFPSLTRWSMDRFTPSLRSPKDNGS